MAEALMFDEGVTGGDPTLGGKIAPPSFQSLYLRLMFGDTFLASGTGFLVHTGIGVALVTARHNLTGRHHETHQCLHQHAGVPDRVEIVHNGLISGTTLIKTESLLDKNGDPRWIEHPRLAGLCDVAILPLIDLACVLSAPYVWERLYPDIAVKVAEPVSVVGFPLNQTGGGSLAVWCTGYIASEPTQDYGGQPQFLVDCRTRAGQSGSPVIAYRNGPYSTQGGATMFASAPTLRPLGVYTGRIHLEADIGVVWKWSVVEDLMRAFDLHVAQYIQTSMIKFGPGSAEVAAELRKFNLTFNVARRHPLSSEAS